MGQLIFVTFNYMYICNQDLQSQLELNKMPRGVQWPMNHIPSCENNYIFIYFEMSLKKFILLLFSSSLSSKLILVTSHSCICNYKPLFSCFYDYKLFLPLCHRGQSHQQSKKWWIWTCCKCVGWNEQNSSSYFKPPPMYLTQNIHKSIINTSI